MKDFVTMKLIGLLLPVILGPITYYAMQGLKALIGIVDRAPSHVKQALVFVIGPLLAALATFSNQELACGTSCTLTDIGPTFIKGVIASGIAFLLHHLKKAPVA